MAQNTGTTTNLTVKVKDQGAHTNIETQYGMRYPDDRIRWTQDAEGTAVTIHFDRLAAGNSLTVSDWHNLLGRRAQKASIDVEEYISQHTLVKRTIVLVTTEPEGV